MKLVVNILDNELCSSKAVVLYGVFWHKWGRAFSNFEPLKTA